MEFDPALLQTVSLLGLTLVFIGGVITSLGPCNVAMVPLIVGFVGGAGRLPRRRAFLLSLFFVIGLALTYMLLGIAAALIGGLIGGSSRWWYYLVAGVCFLIGLSMLGVVNFHLPMWFGGLRERVALKGMPGALVLGLVSGLVASQCATPVLAAILTYTMAEGEWIYGAVLLFVYALGRGVPIVLAGTFTGVLKQLQAFGRWEKAIEITSGIVILLVGFYFLWLA